MSLKIFGTFEVGAGFTDGSTDTMGLVSWIRTISNIGIVDIQVTITYVDQDGNAAEATTAPTTIVASTPSGTFVPIILNYPDTAIRDITNITITGGTAGDKFEVMGLLVAKVLNVIRNTDLGWFDKEITKTVMMLQNLFGTYWDFESAIKDNNINLTNPYAGQIQLANSEVIYARPAHEAFIANSDIYESGDILFASNAYTIVSADLKMLAAALYGGRTVTAVSTTEESIRFRWPYSYSDNGLIDRGFYQLDFDIALNRGTLFTFEVTDKNDVVKYTRTTNTLGFPPSIYSYCGQETGYEVTKACDNNLSTEWRHTFSHTHWIILDVGSNSNIGGVRIYYTDTTGNDWTVDVYVSDTLSFGAPIVSGFSTSTLGAGVKWLDINFAIQQNKRFVKIEITQAGGNLGDFGEVQVLCFEHISLSFKSTSWEARLRCSATGTTSGREYLDLRNICMTRYVNEQEIIPTVHSYCGQESGNPASASVDNNISTSWEHIIAELHWIIYDLGESTLIHGFKFYISLQTNLVIACYVSSYPTGPWKEVFTNKHIIGNLNPNPSPGTPAWNYIYLSRPEGGRYVKFEIDNVDATDYLWGIREMSVFINYGNISSYFANYIPHLNNYSYFAHNSNLPPGTDVGSLMKFSDNGITFSEYTGADGINYTFLSLSHSGIIVPAGYTGFYYQWKVFLISDGRDTPILYDFSFWLYVHSYLVELLLEKRLSYPLLPANPLIPQAIPFKTACPRETPGYPIPSCPGGSYLSETLSSHTFTGKIYVFFKLCPRTTPGYPTVPCTGGTWSAETLSGYTWIARYFSLMHTFLESVVGQVLSGYVRDQNENIIIDGIKVIITSTYSTAYDQMGNVNKNTGFYQVFVKNTKYDGRYLIVEMSSKTFDIVFRKFGTPLIIDGTTLVPSPQDLHFYKPAQICGKSVAFVGSLVTY